MTVHNFYSGPSVLPKAALERAKAELLNFAGTGMSVMEISHRSDAFDQLIKEAEALLREVMRVPKNFKVLFMSGGASLQFGLVPMNFLRAGDSADYILTGGWSEKALKEAKSLGQTRVSYTGASHLYRHIPKQSELDLSPKARYVHMTSNNTLFGTQWHQVPDTQGVPLIADMSSDIASKPIDITKFSLIYAGAQKNIGPSGLVVVLVEENFLATAQDNLPTMLKYKTYAEHDSLYNTPNTWGIYMLRNVLDWIKSNGGTEALAIRNQEKAGLIYGMIDEYPSLYLGHADKESRSLMNITWTLPSDKLEKEFLKGAEEQNLIGLSGHRSVGGIRASTYNALPLASVEALKHYMQNFAKAHA
ncbi:MAG: 3-phosphoserine/phosphohydroxythreonine transaminase [Pseudomonadota bacterium]